MLLVILTVYLQTNLMDPILDDDIGNYSQVRNNVALSSACPESPIFEGSSNSDAYHSTPINSSPSLSGLDGNEEADIAVVMSLLEADAGFCPPIDLSTLPWDGL